MEGKPNSNDKNAVLDIPIGNVGLLEILPGPTSIEVWVCPNCHRYAGSSELIDLDLKENHRTSMKNTASEDPSEWGKTIGPRSICQHCRQNGKGDHLRIKVRYVQMNSVISVLADRIREMNQDVRG